MPREGRGMLRETQGAVPRPARCVRLGIRRETWGVGLRFATNPRFRRWALREAGEAA